MNDRQARGRLSAPTCPIGGPEHGTPYQVSKGFYCPHQAHLGRPSTHKEGPAPQTRAFFTDAEIHNGLQLKENT